MFKLAPPDRLCVVRLSDVGDTCRTLAVVRTIQDTWPETAITWIIGKPEAALLADIPDIEFIIFDESAGVRAWRDVRRRLHGRRFDAVLCMQASTTANLLGRLVRSRLRIGYDFARAHRGQWLVTNRRIPAGRSRQAQDPLLAFARQLGVPTRPPRWDIPLADAHREFAARFLRPGQPTLVVHPGAGRRDGGARPWSAENYAAAARRARQKFGCRILVTGGNSADARHFADTICRVAGDDTVNLAGRTTLKQLYALLSAADAVLCPEAAPAELAAAAGTQAVVLDTLPNPAAPGHGREPAGHPAPVRLADVNDRLDRLFAGKTS